MKTTATPKGNLVYLEYSFEGIPLGRSAYTVKDVIRIQPGLEDDKGLLAHEMTHVDQWHTKWLYQFRYNKSASFRQQMEIEAYANQLKEDGNMGRLKEYAMLLAENYNLPITWEKAARELVRQVGGYENAEMA